MVAMKPTREQKCEPFLKWPGGKRWLAPILADILKNELSGCYYEPFLGAGAVFLHLQPTCAVLSDRNKDLVEFLCTVREYPDEVVRAVWRWSNTADCYYHVRSCRPRTEIGRAARFLYLNRTCWGGIYRTNKEGHFNVPFGDSGRGLCRLIHVCLVAAALSSATLLEEDFESILDGSIKGDVVYADPPYTAKGEDNGFLRYNERLFSWSDQERLAATCKRARRRGVFVAVSGLSHPELMALYKGWWVLKLMRHSLVSRIPTSRKKVSEVVLFSRRPHLPVASGYRVDKI